MCIVLGMSPCRCDDGCSVQDREYNKTMMLRLQTVTDTAFLVADETSIHCNFFKHTNRRVL